MNCNPCCGCLPPITTYDPSVANNFPTILQQVEYLKALLKKYPSQQWFITQEKVTKETKYLNKLSILTNGREPQGGDFILGNEENGSILLFQYTGVITEYVNYNLIYVGVFTNQDTSEALAKAQQALDLAKINEKDIETLNGEIVDKVDKIKEQGEYIRIYGVSKDGVQTTYEASETDVPWKIVRRDKSGSFDIPAATKSTQPVRKDTFDFELSKKQNTITDTTNLDARYISAVSAFRKVTLVGSHKTYSNINFENGREAGGDIYVLTRGNTKTLFGNKSLYGTGNIDLYHHEITYGAINDGITITVNFEHYSSNNLKADSLTDVKTLLGNTFKKGIFGSITNTATGKALTPLYISETNIFYIGEDGSVQNQSLTGNFTDTVTTI